MTERRRDDMAERCDACGAEPAGGMAPPTAIADDGTTHCEWCGAEYPVPGPPEPAGTPEEPAR